ncbi:tyrosyl-tRNA synthetase [Penicillium maclennaniae]|uniref:tyrosyl-tRNA synthetase n=1 Tax=Penicillium maclennaniae TaxID=1343394 RepID=UPI0025411E9F|nr:tyrosyl-tRNA synthetase [Penicillium maclennaniae]KAJ5676506.1 tyrosyl-tRNA synthetase [Penicillium maclennaniae]
MALTKEEQLALINENLAEVLNPEIIEDVLNKGETLKIYWGTATTGAPHCGYFVPIMKIAQLLKAGANVKILLADVHAFLDNLKAPIELVEYRAKYYRFAITALLKACNVPVEKLEFVLGSSYQLSAKYTMDTYRACSITSTHDCAKAGSEVVKQSDNPPLSGLIYPILQALDEEYLDVHCQFGGVDQRKIFALAKDLLPKLGYSGRAHIMNPIVQSLSGGKMSSSDANSKIDLLDTPEIVGRKVKKANAPPKQVEDNGLLAFTEHVLLPASSLLDEERLFKVEQKEGEPLVYRDIESMKKDYAADVLTPQLLKPAVTAALCRLLAPIQKEYQESTEWQEVRYHTAAFCLPRRRPEGKKKKKDKGTRHPGARAQAEEGKDVSKEPATEADVGKSAADAMDKLAV